MPVKIELTEREIFLTSQSVKRLASDTRYQADNYDQKDLRRYQLAALSGELTELAVKIENYKPKCNK